MFRKLTVLILAVALGLAAVSAAAAEETGLFGELSLGDGADERLALLEEAAETVALSFDADGYSAEVAQAYYEGNRIFVSYRISGDQVPMHDGLVLENGAYADIIAGEELEGEDGSLIGWKECVIPEEEVRDRLTFQIVFGYDYENSIGFTLDRREYERTLTGTSPAASYQAEAELYIGKADMTGTIRLKSPEQAAGWLAWQEGEEETGADTIGCWTLYRDGEPVSGDLYGSFLVNEDEVIFEVMFPLTDDPEGLELVPEYTRNGENRGEAIALVPVPEE